MNKPSLKSVERADSADTGQHLSTRYVQLLGSAKLLTSGDIGKAEIGRKNHE
jgi:hypothetical protein